MIISAIINIEPFHNYNLRGNSKGIIGIAEKNKIKRETGKYEVICIYRVEKNDRFGY